MVRSIILNSTQKMKTKKLKTNKLVLIIGLIPLVLILYLVSQNYIFSHEIEYLYDIGNGNENYLSPVDRISEPINTEYRELQADLVYFDAEVPKNAESITVTTKLKNIKNQKISLGAKDKEEWHYTYKPFENYLIETQTITRNGKTYVSISSDSNIWYVVDTIFNLEQDKLFIKDNKLSLVYHVPKLVKTNSIPIDWINIKIKTKGII